MGSSLTKCTLNDKLLHPNDYIAAIEMRGKDVTLTISEVVIEELTMQGGKKDSKPVLKFRETKKKFICNKTNASSIASMYGRKAEAWVGKRITLFPTQAPVGKKMEDCIRIRERVPGDKADTAAQFSEPEQETRQAEEAPDAVPAAPTSAASPAQIVMPTTPMGKRKWDDLVASAHAALKLENEELKNAVAVFLSSIDLVPADLDDNAKRQNIGDVDGIDWSDHDIKF